MGSAFVRAGRGVFGLAQWQPGGIDAQVQRINEQTRRELHRLLHEMPAERFEALVGELLLQMGFDESTVRVTKRSGDGGVDVDGIFRAAGLTEVHAAVQVKRWKANVGAKVVRELRGSLQVHQQGIILTTGGFSRSAQEEASAANKTRISLIDGKALLDLLIKHRVGVQEKTLTVMSLDDEGWGELVDNDSGTPVSETPGDPPSQSTPPRRKPRGMILFDESHPADSWRSVLIITGGVLAERHGDAFGPAAFTVRGRKRQYVAPTPDGMIHPAPIPGTDLWLETNLSARSCLRVAQQLLAALGHDPVALAIL